jgi:hypothetical protein
MPLLHRTRRRARRERRAKTRRARRNLFSRKRNNLRGGMFNEERPSLSRKRPIPIPTRKEAALEYLSMEKTAAIDAATSVMTNINETKSKTTKPEIKKAWTEIRDIANTIMTHVELMRMATVEAKNAAQAEADAERRKIPLRLFTPPPTMYSLTKDSIPNQRINSARRRGEERAVEAEREATMAEDIAVAAAMEAEAIKAAAGADAAVAEIKRVIENTSKDMYDAFVEGVIDEASTAAAKAIVEINSIPSVDRSFIHWYNLNAAAALVIEKVAVAAYVNSK